MKRIALALAIFVSLMLPATSHAEWIEVVKTKGGHTFYIDTKIRKHGGHIYYWELINYLKPTKYGDLSSKNYIEGDCGTFRYRNLQASYHTQPMGRGAPSSGGSLDNPWEYLAPGSVGAATLEKACKMAD
jgi:hypothetical protein